MRIDQSCCKRATSLNKFCCILNHQIFLHQHQRKNFLPMRWHLESMTGSLYRRKKYKLRVSAVARGRSRRVFNEEEEVKFASALRKRFITIGEGLTRPGDQVSPGLTRTTLRALMQKHLQNLVRTNPSRVTGWENNDQRPNANFLRRFAERNNLPISN